VSWFFDKRFYAELYPDVIEAGLDSLIHFMAFGVAELRNPHPLINLKYILSSTRGLLPEAPSITQLLDFLTRDVSDPSRYFSLPYYKSQLDEDELPPGGLLRHFLQSGMLRGRRPVPGFTPIGCYQEACDKSFDIRQSLRDFVRSGEPVDAKEVEPAESAAVSTIAAQTTIAQHKIHLYCLALNEACILPFFLRHYRNLVDRFFVFDNGSTDTTLSLLGADDRVQVTHFDVEGDSFVEHERRMSDTMWQQSRGRATWVIVIDMDEFLFHPDLRGYLDECEKQGITAIDTTAYEMVTDHPPSPDRPLSQTVVCGVRERFYDKLCVFNPNAIARTNYAAGRHSAMPTGRVIWPPQREVKLLHYKRLGVNHIVERYAQLKPHLGPRDISERWGVQYLMTRGEVEREFRRFQRDAAPVPGLSAFGDPDLRLIVDGRVLRPTEIAHNTYIFHPQSGGTEFRLVVHPEAAIPRHVPRGVPVARIFLRTSAGVHSIEPHESGLTTGWLSVERVGPVLIRWTGGEAVLPVPAEIGLVTALEITLRWPLLSGAL
jgi:hypothetical protein